MRISGLAITLLLATALAPPMAAAQQPLPRPGQDIPLPAPQGQRPAPVQQAPAQQAPAQQAGPQQPAPPKPYKPVAVQLPAPIADPSLEPFRKELTAIAQRKDRAALTRLVVARGFFWEREDGKPADSKKSGIDNLTAALGLDAPDGAGWEALATIAAEPSAAPDADKKNVVCAPASPNINENEFEALTNATQTDPTEWAYPRTAGVEMRAAAQPNAPVVERLGLTLVRVIIDDSPANAVNAAAANWLRVVAPSGKVGFVAINTLNTLVSDQICYSKDASGWKIAGIIGGGGGDQP